MIQLTILGVPFAKQSFRFSSGISKCGKVFVNKYQPKDVIEAEGNIRAQIVHQLPDNFIPWENGVIVKSITFCFPKLKSMKRKTRDAIDTGEMVYKITKPDLTDNLMKGLFDALKGIVFVDDSQVCHIASIKKIYTNKPMIFMELEEVENNLDKEGR